MRKKKKEESAENGRFKGQARLLLAGLTLVTLLAGVSCGGVSGEQRAQGPAADESQEPPELEHPSLDDEGNEDAPVVLIEYADFQ